jgi:uncharacterized metal-binding protein YceD (DUF177 family)
VITPEFSRRYALDTIGATPRRVEIAADDEERAALAARFDLVGLDALTAVATLTAVAGGVVVEGRLKARLSQRCVVSGDPVPATIDEGFALRFVETPAIGDEIELGESDLDVLPLESGGIDLGEAVAQTLGLSIDPFPRSPGADAATEWRAGPQGGAFAGLKNLLN